MISNSHFKELEHRLSWEGEIDGIPATIKIECPPQDSIYEAWQHPVGHCHGHVWWPVSKTGLVKCIEIRGKE